MHETFDKMMQAYNAGNEREFTAYARALFESEIQNPFLEKTVEHSLFFTAKKFYKRWMAQGIDSRSAKRNMTSTMMQLAERRPDNPYPVEEPKKEEINEEIKPEIKEEPKEDTKVEIKEETLEENKQDISYLMACMVNAYNRNDNASYEMYVIHLMDVVEENPFLMGTDEYEMFSTMMACYKKNPPNKRRTFVVGKELCDLINNTEIVPEAIKPKTVLGVLPEEKKSWLNFLFPWRKNEPDDSEGID